MEIIFCYNIKNYVEKCKEVNAMQIDGVLDKYKRCSRYNLGSAVSEYICYVEKEPFFVSPVLTSVKTDDRLSTLNPKFVLFSAPGATGKSTMAKYIASKYDALYWDLPKTDRIGTGTFDGSILRAVGAPKYSQFIADLNDAKALLVIDAFDEAEIISGRKMLSTFITDISVHLVEHSVPSVFLFARTETAQYIASFCADNSIPIVHYEIGFFQETAAKTFITQSIVDDGKTPTLPDIECVDAYYNVVRSNITPEESQSFLGYAPVLQAISVHIKQHANRSKLLSELSNQRDCTAVIMAIMGDLLYREQTEKVVPAFEKRCKEVCPEFADWDKVYSEKEQLVRLINYILFGDMAYTNYPLSLPPQLVAEYQALLDLFIPQHPFVRNSFVDTSAGSRLGFTGPAFRDYALARMLQEPDFAEYAQIYFEESDNQSYFPSQVFFDCYRALSKDTVSSEHLSYVYDSYRAKATALERPYLQCSESLNDDSETYSYTAVFGMLSDKSANKKDDIIMNLSVRNSELSFDQLSNISLDTPNLMVKIGKTGAEARITNSSIISDSIEWATRNISIESHNPEGCLIVAKNKLVGAMPSFEIVSDANLRISAPNITEFYRLIPYKYDFEDSSSIDITKFIYGLRCIMSEFRTDKKDMLAKMADRIDNVIVGGSPIKKSVLEYLKDVGVIYKSGHLYKINEPTMRTKGIHFAALARMDTTHLAPVYSDFKLFESKNNR